MKRLNHLGWLFTVLLLAGCATAGAATLPAPHHTSTRSHIPKSGAALARLIVQPVPVRNLYNLTEQLKLHPPRPFAHVIRTTTVNYPVGRQDRFWVLSEDENRYFKMTATLRAKTAHFYIYLQNGVQASQSAIHSAALQFENHIYPTDRKYFGSEWRPGVDNDVHITCLIGDLRSTGVGGYYSAEDEYPHAVNPYSNQREMFYINSGQGSLP